MSEKAYQATKQPWWQVELNCGGMVMVRPLWRADALLAFWLKRNAYRLPGYGHFYRVTNRILHRFGAHWYRRVYIGQGYLWCDWCGSRRKPSQGPGEMRE